jgi:hypothetical protein
LFARAKANKIHAIGYAGRAETANRSANSLAYGMEQTVIIGFENAEKLLAFGNLKRWSYSWILYCFNEVASCNQSIIKTIN